MKKSKELKSLSLQLKRARKRLKRKRRSKQYKGPSSVYIKLINFWANIDWQVIGQSNFRLYEFFKESKFLSGSERISSLITIPSEFSLIDKYEPSIKCIKDFFCSTYFLRVETITLDFSKCQECDQAAVFVLQIFKLDLLEFFNQLDAKLRVVKRRLKFNIIESKSEKVNKLLFLGGLIPSVDISNNERMHPVTSMGYYRGKKDRRHYLENKKGVITSSLVGYINECLSGHEFSFNAEGINELEGLISEILNNAEDHSPFNTYYATANFQKEKNRTVLSDVVGEVNLSIMNFGFSIFEGFEKTRNDNSLIYHMMSDLFSTVSGKPFFSFTKENMFTLYALQDGISRLNYEDSSRGTGTMKFINSFFSFGDYEDEKRDYFPNLTFFSGGTELICDNRFKPFEKSGMYSLSLNSAKDLLQPPEKSHLRSLKSPFPGTLIVVKLFLNNEHLNKKYGQAK